MQLIKSVRILTLAVVLFSVAPVLSAAGFGVRAGRYNDADENFVGAEAVIDFGSFKVNPNIEYSLADNVTAGTANIDLTYDLIDISRVTPYIGAGVGLSYVDPEIGGSRTDPVGNLIGGVSLNLDYLKPYAQIKYFRTLEDTASGDTEDDVALTIGLRF